MQTQRTLAQKYEVDSVRIKQVIANWNEAHNGRSEDAFEGLYAPAVLFYANYLSKRACIAKKQSLLNGQRFEQRIVTDLQLQFYEDGMVYCGFTKEVTTIKGKRSYPSYLLLKRTGDRYLISGEGDLITDRNLKFHLALGPQVPLSKISSVSFNKAWWQSSTAYWMLALVGLVLGAMIYSVNARSRTREVAAPKRDTVPSFPEAQIVKTQQDHHSTSHKTFDVESLLARLTTPRKASVKNKRDRDTSLAKGHTFEEFVVNRFRDQSDYFKWMDATSDKGVKGYFPESNMNPDLHYEYRIEGSRYPFAVECKFRSMTSGEITVTKDGQLERYRKFGAEKRMEVFIVLGLGGTPSKPKELFVIPLAEAKQEMDKKTLHAYRAQPSFYYDVKQRRLY